MLLVGDIYMISTTELKILFDVWISIKQKNWSKGQKIKI